MRVSVRCTQTERDAIWRRARVLGVRPSTWVRAVMLDALDSRSDRVSELEVLAATPAPTPELATAVEQVRRLGVLFNQQLRRGLGGDAELLRDARAALDAVRDALGDRVAL